MKHILHVVLIVLFFSGCSGMFFYPNKTTYRTPTYYDLKYEDVYFDSSDKTKLHAWHIYPKQESKGMVFVAHGNAQNISAHFMSWIWLVKEGYEVFIFDYREYGKSEGKSDLKGSVEDTKAALDFIEKRYKKPFFACGQSLGGTMLLNALHDRDNKNIKAVIIDSTFTSFSDIAQDKMDKIWLAWPFQWIPSLSISDDFDSKDRVKDIKIPILFIHGSQDNIVNPNNSWQLFELAPMPKELWIVKGSNHIEAFKNLHVEKDFLRFLRDDYKNFNPNYSQMRIYEDNLR